MIMIIKLQNKWHFVTDNEPISQIHVLINLYSFKVKE